MGKKEQRDAIQNQFNGVQLVKNELAKALEYAELKLKNEYDKLSGEILKEENENKKTDSATNKIKEAQGVREAGKADSEK